MWTFRTIGAVVAGAMIAGMALSNAAQAQATCDWYAKTAMEQQKINVDRKCGFKGESWSSDRASHIAWCASVGPDMWKRQAQFRDQELGKCSARK